MPGLPSFSVETLSAEQIEKYKLNQSADLAAREIADALGLADYQHDAATAICLDYVSYVLNFARSTNFSQKQSQYVLNLAQQLLQQTAGSGSIDELQSTLRQQLTGADQESSLFLPKQISQIAQFFNDSLFAHSKLYNFFFTQPQEHDEQHVSLKVETAIVQPLKDALTEEQWAKHNADIAAAQETRRQADEAAEQQRQLAEAQAAQQLAAEQAAAERQSKLTKPVQTLEEAVEQAVAQRVEAERKVLEAEYHQREAALLDTVTQLEAKLAAIPASKKK